MSRNSIPRFVSLFTFLSQAAATFSTVVGGLVLVGWSLDIALLKSVIPGLATMKANTALSFALAGLSLTLLRTGPGDHSRTPAGRHLVAQGCASIVTLVGLLTLFEYLFGWDLGIDQLLVRDPEGVAGTAPAGRMAPATALNFLTVGCALLLLDVEARPGYWPAQILAVAVVTVSFVALIGYVYGIQSLYAVVPYSSVALHTAFAFMVLAHGLLLARPDRGFVRVLASELAGGVTARRLVPAVLGIPVVLGWLVVEGERAGGYESAFGFALFTTLTMIIFAILIWLNAFSLNRTDRERILAEQRLRLNAAALEAAANGVIITDRKGRIIWVNPAYTRLTGYTSEEAIGKTPRILKSGKHQPWFYEHMWATMLSGQVWRGELVNRRKDGSLYTEEQTITPVPDERGEISHFIAIKQDVTERKLAELQIRTSLKEKEVLLREVYHRVKNNLQVISSLLNLRAEYIQDPKAAEMFRDSQSQIRSMALVHEKLYQSGDLAKLDFAGYTRDLVSTLLVSYGADPGRVVLTIDVEKVSLTLDSSITCGLIINELVSNALKYAFPDGQKGNIKIGAWLDADNEVCLTIADNGVGLPVGLDFTDTATLGLQLVNTLVKQLQGRIEVHTNGGTEFRIRFKEVAYKPRE